MLSRKKSLMTLSAFSFLGVQKVMEPQCNQYNLCEGFDQFEFLYKNLNLNSLKPNKNYITTCSWGLAYKTQTLLIVFHITNALLGIEGSNKCS